MISPRNRLLFWVMSLLPTAAVSANYPDYGWVCPSAYAALLVVAGIDGALGYWRQLGLEVCYEGLARLTRDRPGSIRLRIRRGESTVHALEIGLPLPVTIESEMETYPVKLDGRSEDYLVDWPCVSRKRGKFVLDTCYYITMSPLGFWNLRGSSASVGEIRSYPNLLEDRNQAAALFLRGGKMGSHLIRMTGQGREFDQLREYQPGDGLDTIDWKATAKRNSPITKTYQAERTQEVYVFLDLSRLSARRVSDEPVLERYINTALLLGLTAEQHGDHFGLVTFSDQAHTFLKASSGKSHFNACREALYTATPRKVNPDFESIFTFIRTRMRRRALLVFLTDLRDPVFAESFAQSCEMVGRNHLVLVNMIQAEGVRPLFDHTDVSNHRGLVRQLAGHMVWQKLKEVERELAATGITLSITDEDGLTAEVLNQYVRIKQRQLL